jgi:hypothetical protein
MRVWGLGTGECKAWHFVAVGTVRRARAVCTDGTGRHMRVPPLGRTYRQCATEPTFMYATRTHEYIHMRINAVQLRIALCDVK